MSDRPDSALLPSFGTRVYKLRHLNGYETQEALAHHLGVSDDTVSSWKRGKQFLRIPDIRRLCEALRVDAHYLLFGEERFLSVEMHRRIQEYVPRQGRSGAGRGRP